MIEERRLLVGKTAIVTGGAYGIGRAIAEAFLQEGARVAILDLNQARLDQTRQQLMPYGVILSYRVDVRNKAEIEKAVMDIEAKLGPVDILVNNAGINPHALFTEVSDEMWSETLAVNVTGAFYMTQIVAKRMIEHGVKGSIVFITSVHTLLAYPEDVAYDVSKHALLGLMRVCAVALKKFDIRSNAVAPGAIYPTGITEQATQQDIERVASRFGRMGKPEEIAKAVVFLASDMASYINGAQLVADDGLVITSVI